MAGCAQVATPPRRFQCEDLLLSKHENLNIDDLLTVHLSIILATDQLNAQILVL
jgi:hypothetical protein